MPSARLVRAENEKNLKFMFIRSVSKMKANHLSEIFFESKIFPQRRKLI